MPSYTAGDRVRTPARPTPLTAPQAREPTAIPAAAAAPSRGPPRTALPTTRTSSGPGVSDSSAARSTKPQRLSMPGGGAPTARDPGRATPGRPVGCGVPLGGRVWAEGEPAQTSGTPARGGMTQPIVEGSRNATSGGQLPS